MSSISLEAAIRTCKVDTSWANRIASDRFLNPNVMVCPIWNGVDTAGRSVCPDSFVTKRAGCNSASDRVVVENDVTRPQYMQYINLSANGIKGNIYGKTMAYQQTQDAHKVLSNINKITGNFGSQHASHVYPSCGAGAYQKAMAQDSQQQRQNQAMQMGYEGYTRRQASGF